MTSSDEYILWLPSWYPNEFEPYNGDFIQRHARATSEYCKIVVFHFMQLGHTFPVATDYFQSNEEQNLTEYRVAPAFSPTGYTYIDKVSYNIKFYKYAKKYLKAYFKKNGIPKIVHVHVPIKAGIIALWIKRKYNIKYIVSEHSSHYLPESLDSYYRKNYIYKKQTQRVFKNANIVTNVSATIGKILKSIFKIGEVLTIHNTVNTSYFYLDANKYETFTFIHVSTLSKQKNILGILNVFEQLSKTGLDWKLILVGPYTNYLLEIISSKGLNENIKLTGEVPYFSVASYMQKSHAFVLFSDHENFPCVIIEALCCGLPVISSDVAGVKEAVNEENGILVNPKNEADLLRAIIHIRTNYQKYNLEKIAENAQARYNYKVIGKQIFNLYSIDK